MDKSRNLRDSTVAFRYDDYIVVNFNSILFLKQGDLIIPIEPSESPGIAPGERPDHEPRCP